MEIEISRLDHHGVVAGVIKDLGRKSVHQSFLIEPRF